ncbi:unnamed protein product [Prunus brigantina]
MTACVGISWPLFEHFGPILGGFEVWVYMPSSRTAIVSMSHILGLIE